MSDTNAIIDQIRNDLQSASEAARTLFERCSAEKTKAQFDLWKKSKEEKGAVYVYYGSRHENQVIYVGQTSRHVKDRLLDQTSPHQLQGWWETWTTMRFLLLKRIEDRLILEDLLIIAYSPTHNVKPGSIGVKGLFADLTSTNES